MIKKYLTYLLVLSITLLIIGSIFGYRYYQDYLSEQKLASFSPAPVSVSTAKVTVKDWQFYISAIGSLEAVNGVDLAPQVSGVVVKIFFNSGQMINAGYPIIQLDTSVLEAELTNAIAARNYKAATFKRTTKLSKTGAVSNDQVDVARSDLNQADASVEQIKAQIAQMTIYAPFSGKLGIRDVNLGQYLSPGSVITNIQTVNPILVNFSVPTQNLEQIKMGQAIDVTTDADPTKTFTGKIIALDASIDINTRSINIQGQIANPEGKLIPGMFVSVNVLTVKKADTILIPQTAVTYTLYGNSVYVVDQSTNAAGKTELTAVQKYVTVGQRQGDLVVITKGLTTSDTVVTSGQLKLQNNTPISENNSVSL